MPHYRTIRSFIFTVICAALMLPAAVAVAKPAKPADRARAATPAKQQLRVKAHIAVGTKGRVPRRPAARIAQESCQNADLQPAAGNLAAIRDAVLCLHNEIRARNDLPLLRENFRLRRAASGHSEDMVSRRYFDHTAPGGVTMTDRILRARYARSNQGWAFGENLAWGTGRLATARGVMQAWMDSPGHRANVLRRSYRELGIGVVTGIPSGGESGATYTADFGVRR
jgi:uncharacterized protein YkwD